MATFCTIRKYDYFDPFESDDPYDALVVVPPVSLYSELTTQQARGTVLILTDQENNYVDVQQTHGTLSTVLSPPVTWKNVPGTRFKVGTLRGGGSTTTIRSNSTFAVLGYDRYFIYNGGYSFRTYPDTVTSAPDGTGNTLNTKVPFQETYTRDRSGIKLTTVASFQAGISINATTLSRRHVGLLSWLSWSPLWHMCSTSAGRWYQLRRQQNKPTMLPQPHEHLCSA
ncbi:uncharacterized protein LOC124264990 [Haliotis rubra]|uniref:uncharacterized protein LOC124264990 n=1 Tax=Haliotis rubra TaxID=36100 RepID=UPI001EE61FCF|nr:uncharacterized protein LOC124264990 [Haliotis rubra]